MKRCFKIKRLIIILIIGGVLVMSICLLFGYFNIEPTHGLGIGKNDIKLTNDKVEIQGMLLNSSKYVIDYKYNIKGDALYLSIYTSYIIIPDATKLGDINFTIEMDTSTINNIYLQGRNDADTKLIWERN